MNIQNFFEKRNLQEEKLQKKFGQDFSEEAIGFTINKAEAETIKKWHKALQPEIVALQQSKGITSGSPEYGAIGGGLTYSFMPTSLGNIILVKESVTGKELNVSEALNWFFFG